MSQPTFLFYDLETSGFSPREQRVMQFAAQRTDLKLNLIGEPYNYLIKLSDDVLPDPDAVMLTGITPQATVAGGITEAEFLKIFTSKISLPGTIFTGFNSIRFDDEFMRFLHYRNFYDAYQWHWADDRSRWDLLDVVRMTRALRPEGIKWPFDSKGRPANQLGLLTSINKLEHANAHDALSDVLATISLAKLLLSKQPKLFNYLLEMRSKNNVKKLVDSGEPFVYTSGKYSSEYDKTSVAIFLEGHPKKIGALVYDLRFDPTPFLTMSAEKLAEMWQHFCKVHPCTHPRLPVKTLQFNRCPAVAPLNVLDADSQKRLKIDLKTVARNHDLLRGHSEFTMNLITALQIMDKLQQTRWLTDELEVDAKLYDDFISDSDKLTSENVRQAEASQLDNASYKFKDDRLRALLPLYKARNFPKTLTPQENETWESFKHRKLLGGKNSSRAAKFFNRLSELATETSENDDKQFLLSELQLWAQSILPLDD